MSQSQFLSQTQFGSQSQAKNSTWASLPLVKFSYVKYQSTRSCPAWTHLHQDKDLRLDIQIFCSDEQGILGRQVIMEVFTKDTLLESQSLSGLVQLSQSDPSMVAVVEMSPRIAMRYAKDPDMVWKCEIRFSSDADFKHITSAMKDLGLPVEQHKPRLLPLTSPAPSNLVTATPMLSTTPALPAGSFHIPHARPSSTSTLPLVASGLARLPPVTSFKVPERPATAEISRQIPSTIQSFSRALESGPRSIPLPTRSETHVTPFHGPAKPLYSLQLERESQGHQLSQSISQETKYDVTSSQARPSAFLHQLQTQQMNDGEGSASRPRLLSFSRSPFFEAAQNTPSKSNDDSQDPFSTSEPHPSRIHSTFDNMVAPPRRELPFERPSSTPASVQDFTIPPRRDLPFSRPEPTSRPSSALDLPPLPKPTPVVISKQATDNAKTTGTVKAAPVKRVAQRKAPIAKDVRESSSKAVSPLKSLTFETTIEPPMMREDEPSPLAAKSAAASRPASAASGLVSKAIIPPKKRVATPNLPLPSAKRPKMDIMPADDSVPETDPAPSAPTTHESYLNDLDAFVASHMARPAPKELRQMPGYAEADTDRRHAMLDDFICQNLQDPDFLKLCDDMDNAWRRIGLGH
ncbi:hypothetical protein VTL71DRAFT_14196 [Oculimacula yallundae]|uniref:Uncharacterized protein n=1 Tax=Oculimacula yallundae TaxID=86028 RepID=A0ABR4CHS3_9HELO